MYGRGIAAGLGLIAVVALLAVLGPRSRARPKVGDVVLPADLDAYLASAESRVPNLRPGCAKGIRWADPATKTPTPVSIVYLHGFPASRDELAPVCDRLAGAWSANVFYTRLAGHGADEEALGHVRANDWFEDADEAWAIGRRIGRRVVLIGMSTGAPLAAWLACTRPEAALLVLVSPNFAPADPRTRWLLWPWGRQLARIVAGRAHVLIAENAEAARIWTIRSRSESLAEMMAVADFGSRLDLERLAIPALVVYTGRDELVNVGAIRRAFERIGSSRKKCVDLPGARRHVLAGDCLSPGTTPELVRTILDFARETGVGSR
ncbi:MAG: alpha/beta hydrolase [Candidatus Coatesbacteria bacterium]